MDAALAPLPPAMKAALPPAMKAALPPVTMAPVPFPTKAACPTTTKAALPHPTKAAFNPDALVAEGRANEAGQQTGEWVRVRCHVQCAVCTRLSGLSDYPNMPSNCNHAMRQHMSKTTWLCVQTVIG